MTNTYKFGAAGLAIAAIGMSAPAFAQTTASASAEAEILSALTLTKVGTTDLDFGSIVISGTPTALAPATVVLDPDTMDVTCSAALVCSGTTSAAQFQVDGSAGADVRVNLPATATLSFNDGVTTHNLTADDFNIYSLNETVTTGNLQEFVFDANGIITGTQDALTNPLDPTSTTEVTSIALDATTGSAYFSVGATLSITDAAQAAGLYTGTFNVSVEYN